MFFLFLSQRTKQLCKMALAVVLNLWTVFMVARLPKLSEDVTVCKTEKLSVTKL